MYKPTILLAILFITLSAQAQKATISGYISDKNSRERLINANVYENNTLQGTTANNFGFYSISLPKGKITLVASFIGYTPQQFEIDLQENTTINFDLELKSDQLDEITVVGNQINKVEDTQMSMIDIPIQKLQKIPVIMGEADVLKVIQLLPGVQGGTEGTSGIYVRGGGPDQNLFLLDGVPVYNASHLLGFFSVFNPDAIKTVKLYKGGFPSRFGGRLSSVVDISMKDGNMQKLKGDISIGLISSKLMLEGPIIKDKTSFMVSARRTYLDVMAKPIIGLINKIEGSDMDAGAFFHDYNMKVNHIFNDRSRLYISGYFGKDKGFVGNESTSNRVNANNDLIQYKYKDETSLKWGNTIGSARWNYLVSPKLFSNTTVTYSKYLFDVGSNFKATNITENTFKEDIFRYYSGIEDITGKIDFDYFPTPRHSIKFGTAYTYHHFTPGAKRIQLESVVLADSSGINKDFANRDIFAHDFAAYIEDDITITENLKINAGLHLSVFNVQNETFIRPQPRISLRYKANDNWAMKASYTRMAQHVHLLTSSGISMPTDLWLPVTKNFAPPISDQFVLGTAINLPLGLNLTLEGFYKTMTNLIEYKEGASFMGNDTNWEEKVEKGKGWSYGAEVMLEKTIGKTTGWIGYTWSKTERQFDNLNFGNPFPAKYDRRHDVSIAITHKISDKIDIGGTWVYGTGNAVTLAIMDFPSMEIPYSNSWYSGQNLKDYGGRNNYRMPAYHRMDLGVNLHKEKKHGTRTWSFSLYNAYNNMNPFLLEWGMKQGDYIYNSVTGERVLDGEPEIILEKLSIFPMIPSISYSFKF
ncbi:MAG: TonB-dependent receptor [Prolixibacteraceae bacterium]|nr:TonB-dependent receptor [Prolixibacteraceae bacterium]